MANPQTSTQPQSPPVGGTDVHVEMLRTMLRARLADERLIRLFRQGQIIGGVYSSIGQEAIGAASTAAGLPQDLYAPLIRNMAVHIGRGASLLDVFRQWLGRVTGPTRGRDGNLHYGIFANGVYAMISHLGAMIPVVTGGVMAKRHQGSDAIGFAYIGDGGTSTGDFHEGVNFAAVFHVPLIIIVENNKYAYSTPASGQYRCKRLIDKAPGYGIEGFSADGNDLVELHRLLHRLAVDVRANPRPVMIECDTLRMRGHGEHDDFSYVPPELLEQYRQRDPIAGATKRFIADGIMTESAIAALTQACHTEVDVAYHAAMKDPPPDPNTLLEGVYADA